MVLRRIIFYGLVYGLISTGTLFGQYDSFRSRIISIIPSPTGSTNGEVRLLEQRSNGTNYVGFKAPSSIASNIVWTLPGTDGSSGNCLGWSSSAVLGWIACAGGVGSGLTSLNLMTGSTQTFANANDTNVTLSIGSATDIHTFTLGWTGTLAKARQHTATVYNDAANTWSTGAQDFGSATSLKVPTGAGAAPTASGLIAYDSTAHTLKAGANGSGKTIAFTDMNVATATALAANPVDCGSGEFATGIGANGDLVCATPAGSGNVNGPATHAANYIPAWSTANSRTLVEGFAVSQSATANAIARRTFSGGIEAYTGVFTSMVAVSPDSDTTSLNLRRYSAGQTSNMANFATEVGVLLSAIDKDGNFTGLSAEATALENDPSACPGGQYVTDIAANGTLTCSSVSGGGNVTGPGSSTDDYFPRWNGTTGTVLKGGIAASSTGTASNLVVLDSNSAAIVYDKGGQVYNCYAYGVRANGSDMAANIESCINALPAAGGIAQLPCGEISIASTVDIGDGTEAGTSDSTRHGITLRGCGRGSEDTISDSSAGIQGGTKLIWIGGNLSTKTISGATNATPVVLTVTGHLFTGGTDGASQQIVMVDQAGKSGTCSNDSGANGVYQIRVVDANTLELRGSVGNGTYNAACPGTLYYGDPMIRVNGPILNVKLEDLQLFGNASNSGGKTGTIVTSTTAAVGIEWRNVADSRLTNVGIARVGILGLNMRSSNTTASNLAFFNCNTVIEQLAIHDARHQRISGIHMGGWETSGGSDTCSNKLIGININFGGGVGSFGINEQFSDNNRFIHLQTAAIGGGTGGYPWRRTTAYHDSRLPLANMCDQCFLYGDPKLTDGVGWFPNFGESEIYPSVPPFTNTNFRGFTDTGRFMNTYMQGVDGSAAAPTYGWSQDTNTGLFRQGADVIGFSAGGTERLRLTTAALSPASSGGITVGTEALPFNYVWSKAYSTYTANAAGLGAGGAQDHTWRADDDGNLYFQSYESAASTRFALHGMRARGTYASPSTLDTSGGSERIWTLAAWPYTSIGFIAASKIDFDADTISGAGATTATRFYTSTVSGGLAQRMVINHDGIGISGVTYANLGAPANGTLIYCSDCQITNPCASGGTGAIAKRLNSTWVCN